jgi:hypothetical protein
MRLDTRAVVRRRRGPRCCFRINIDEQKCQEIKNMVRRQILEDQIAALGHGCIETLHVCIETLKERLHQAAGIRAAGLVVTEADIWFSFEHFAGQFEADLERIQAEHPELPDRLAAEFVRWGQGELHRLHGYPQPARRRDSFIDRVLEREHRVSVSRPPVVRPPARRRKRRARTQRTTIRADEAPAPEDQPSSEGEGA